MSDTIRIPLKALEALCNYTSEEDNEELQNEYNALKTEYALLEAKCFRLEHQLKEYDKLKS
jgi:hypothetical protein